MYNNSSQFQYGGSSSSTATFGGGQQPTSFAGSTPGFGGPGAGFGSTATQPSPRMNLGGSGTGPPGGFGMQQGGQTPAFGAGNNPPGGGDNQQTTGSKAADLANSTKAALGGLVSRVTRSSKKEEDPRSTQQLPGLGTMDGGQGNNNPNGDTAMSASYPPPRNGGRNSSAPYPGAGMFSRVGGAKKATRSAGGDRTVVTRCRNPTLEQSPITKNEEQVMSMIPLHPFLLRVRALAGSEGFLSRWLALHHHAFTTNPLVLHEDWHYDHFVRALLNADDGLFRSRANLREHEPWNYWRLLLQLMREKIALAKKCQQISEFPQVGGDSSAGPIVIARQQQAYGATQPQSGNALEDMYQKIVARKRGTLPTWQQYYAELEQLIQFCDFEVVSSRQTMPVFLNSHERSLFKRMNNFRAERMQLKADHMYSLKICLETVTFTSFQHGLGIREKNAKEILTTLYSEEDRLTARLLYQYDEYRRREEGDPIEILDGRFDALVAYGKTLLESLKQAQAQQPQSNALGPGDAADDAELKKKDALERRWALHVQERKKFRSIRTEVERERSAVSDALYKTWQQLRTLRKTQNFVSTPVKLEAQVVSHNAEEDQKRVEQYLQAELEELEFLAQQEQQPFDPSQAEQQLREWYATNWRPPGADTYRFELSWRRERVTNMDELRPISLQEFERRRRLQSGVLKVEITCVVNGEQVGTSGAMPVQWDSWSTSANLSNILDQDLGAVADLARAACPYTFDLCVHTMPRTIELQVWVGVPRALGIFSHGRIRKWTKIGGVQIAIPAAEGTRVTHTPIIRQKLVFGSDGAITAAGTRSSTSTQTYVEGTSASTPRSHQRESQTRQELQSAMEDTSTTTGVIKVRTFWPVPLNQMKDGALPPQPLADSTAMESLHRAFEEGTHLPFFSRFSKQGGKDPRNSQNADAFGGGGSSLLVSRTQQLLEDLRFDPNHPMVQQSRDELDVLLHKSEATAFDPALKSLYCNLKFVNWGNVKQSRRFHKLAFRAQKHSAGGEQIAATDKEVRMQQISANARAILTGEDTSTAQDGTAVAVKLPPKPKDLTPRKSDAPPADPFGTTQAAEPPSQDEAEETAVEDFIAAIQARTRMVSSVKRKYSVKTVVREYGQDAEEIDWAALWQKLSSLLKPRRPLKPAMQQRLHDPSSKRAGIHINVAKLYNVPLRIPSALERNQRGLTVSEVVVELAFENMDKMELKTDTGYRIPGLNPDINQHRVFPLASGLNPNVSLSGDALNAFTNALHFNVFDETEISIQTGAGGTASLSMSGSSNNYGNQGGAVITKRERRYLGTFALPWPTVLANNCKIEGRFRVDAPVGIIGYQKPPSAAAQQRMAQGMPPDPTQGEENEEPMLLFASVTLDRVLTEPESGNAPIIPGKESRAILNHVHQWMASLGSDRIVKENLAQALGTDIEGRSRLVTRFITPQAPPEDIVADMMDPFAIEKCARFVSLITFMTDGQMFEGRAVDLWCTSKTFLDISCGDYEEHAILLCNYFNYIDAKRGEVDPGHQVKSFCVAVDAIPDGDGMYVMRQDQLSGNTEFWDPITNRCYFVPRRGETYYNAVPADPDQAGPVGAITGCVKRLRERHEAAKKGRFTGSAIAGPSPYALTCPIQKVNVVFSAENVWYNTLRHRAESREPGTAAESCVLKMDWDLENHALWRPLFVDESEKKHLFPDGTIETLQPALRYEPPNVSRAKALQAQLEDDIWKRFLRERAGRNLRTRSNAAIAGKCREMLETLEQFKQTRREGGNEAPPPLRAANEVPVKKPDVDAFFLKLEEEFGGHRGMRVYGVPLNLGMSDFGQVWQAVTNTDLLALGSDDAEFSMAVRVFPYSQRICSIWIFLVCVTQ
ncbi:unnamed protein product [Amoebophrya sp. A120]|nr:unnamed protein product [Amoebophrya sp. A120]|eukprot:GSA120T00018440001.1